MTLKDCPPGEISTTSLSDSGGACDGAHAEKKSWAFVQLAAAATATKACNSELGRIISDIELVWDQDIDRREDTCRNLLADTRGARTEAVQPCYG